jgi:hypothetical protein
MMHLDRMQHYVSDCVKQEAIMKYVAFALATLCTVVGSQASFAAYRQPGQREAPPALAAQMALPECGFAATESFGPNGFQLCDGRNIYGGFTAKRPFQRW